MEKLTFCKIARIFIVLLCLIGVSVNQGCTTIDPEVPILLPNSSHIGTYTYGDHPLQNYRLYLPENYNENTEVVIMIHGGGWVMGYHPNDTVTTFSGRYNWDIVSPLLDSGYACAVMKYRTACYNTVPEHFGNNTMKYQDDIMMDIDLIIAELKSRAGSMGFGSDKFHLLGESAGGHIVMTYGIRANASTDVKSVASMFGPTDLDALDFKTIINGLPLVNAPLPNYFLKRANNCESVTNQEVRLMNSLKSFSDHQTIEINNPNPFLDSISPSFESNIQNDIPTFIMHGANDELVPSTQADIMLDAFQLLFYGSSNCDSLEFYCTFKKKIYDNCGHGWTGGNCARAAVMADIVSWIEAH